MASWIEHSYTSEYISDNRPLSLFCKLYFSTNT